MSIWLVAGLGNPGARYVFTRHNAGFRMVDAMAASAGLSLTQDRFRGLFAEGRIDGHRVAFLKPQTFMNRSGEAVVEMALAFDPEARLLVLYDDLDLPPGRLRIRRGGGHGGHKGVESIMAHLGHGDFDRMKLGIGRPPGTSVAEYVLSPFEEEEETLMDRAVRRSVEAFSLMLREGVESAMNRFNADPGEDVPLE